MKSDTKAMLYLLLIALLSVSARELQQTRTSVSTFTSSGGGRVARSSVSLSTTSAQSDEEQASTSNVRVDVYLLLDVTESKRGTLAVLRAEAKSIVSSVFKTSQRVRFGVGEYKDKKDEFSFTNRQTITNEEDAVVKALKDLRFERGTVKAESQLYALQRAAKDKDIGFRTKKSIKIIVWVGDTKGADPIGDTTEASVIAALAAKGIYIVAIDVGSLNSTGQATRIIKARGGALLKKNDSGMFDVKLLETDVIKASTSGGSGGVTTDSIDGPLDLSDAVVKSVRAIVEAADS